MTDSSAHGRSRIIQVSTADCARDPPPLLEASRLKRRRKERKSGPSPLTRLLRYANNRVLSWRDGLSETEREVKRRIEERMQILAARMQNVSTRPLRPLRAAFPARR